MMKAWLLIRANLRSQMRWARQHVYIWLILAPVVLGMSYLSLSRVGDNIAVWQPSPRMAFLTASAFALCLIGLSLSRATVELYHILRPESYTEALPLALHTHLHAALASRLLRTMLMATLLITLWIVIGGGGMKPSLRLPPLVLFTVLSALTETFAALSWIHSNHTRSVTATAVSLIALALSVAIDGVLLVQALRPGLLLEESRLPV
ncbi:MAG TPA: hypothetical protein VLD57_02720, partial [Blastocatellia bacterium]|nr:hypothetical protein [Blastocatellia bacterium]